LATFATLPFRRHDHAPPHCAADAPHDPGAQVLERERERERERDLSRPPTLHNAPQPRPIHGLRGLKVVGAKRQLDAKPTGTAQPAALALEREKAEKYALVQHAWADCRTD
jgi:hypothetical protein